MHGADCRLLFAEGFELNWTVFDDRAAAGAAAGV